MCETGAGRHLDHAPRPHLQLLLGHQLLHLGLSHAPHRAGLPHQLAAPLHHPLHGFAAARLPARLQDPLLELLVLDLLLEDGLLLQGGQLLGRQLSLQGGKGSDRPGWASHGKVSTDGCTFSEQQDTG